MQRFTPIMQDLAAAAPLTFRPLAHARALLRGLMLVTWTALWFVLRLGARPLGGLRPRAWAAVHDGSVRGWARGVARILGMRVTVEGAPPQPPFLLVANHLSYVDIILLWTRVPGDFLAKQEISSWPILGHLTRSAGTLFIDRTRAADLPRVIAELAAVLARRRGAIVFPEGKSTDGATVLPFRPSIFEVALGAACPVRCAAISYTTPPGAAPARLAVCWWGEVSFLDHLYRLLLLPRFEARLTFVDQEAQGADRKELARHAQGLVADRCAPGPGNPGLPRG
jgi:1-acyl-sn-glycerol-3-phosphate acyltransferase